MTTTEARYLRRLGYRPRYRPDPLTARLERAGIVLHPLNRVRPRTGHAYATCPRCGTEGALWREPDGSWSTTCGCWRGIGDDLDLAVFLRGAA